MGVYATTTSLATLMVGTTFDSATTALCSHLITHAENEINKYISKRYDVDTFNNTSTSVPPILTSLCETLTEGYMYKRRARGGKDLTAYADGLIKGVIDNLIQLRDYKVDLLDSSGAPIADFSNTAYRVLTTEAYSSTFNEDAETSWAVDQDKLDDIADDRDS